LIPEQVIGDVRERIDIVALVGEYVRLTKRGNSYVGLCPFHAEKTPSFHVNPANRFFHCFGCKESGDAFGFFMRIEGVPFPQAARTLAERAGVEIAESEREDDVAERKARERLERLASVMEAATAFYEQRLCEAQPSDAARQELAERNVNEESVARFRLGYAPASWDALTNHLRAKGIAAADAEEVGLIGRRREGNGHYDRFRNRLMFPVRELGGRVVAFSGRALKGPNGEPPPETEPKYMNSPETALYHKGSILFGLHEARVEVRRQGWAILCEGNFDLVALHQAGFGQAVAPLGTAFTSAQAKLLKRFAERVVLLFDGDSAGRKATRAAYPLLQEHALRGSVARLPAKDDPDTFLRAHGAEGMSRLLTEAQGIVEHLIDDAAASAGGAAADRARAVESLAPVLAAITNGVELDLHVDRMAQRFGLPDGAAVRRLLRTHAAQAPAHGRPSRPSPEGSPQHGSAVRTPLAPAKDRVKLPQLETELLGALLDRPALLRSEFAEQLCGLLNAPELVDVCRSAQAALQENGELELSALFSALESNPVLPWVRERLARPSAIAGYDPEKELQAGLPRLSKQNVERAGRALKNQIIEARRAGDDDRALELQRQLIELERSAK
jgi:DNA primase